MNHIKWAAWGVVDIEKLDKQQRRNYLKKVHAELVPHGVKLHPGGSTQVPWYLMAADGRARKVNAGEGAFKKACEWVLEQLGEAHAGAAGSGLDTVDD